MGGKSTYLRQTALIVVMAQMSCFVPAREAKLGLVDRVHPGRRLRPSFGGQSTFMVEMQETAHPAPRHARSLVLLDEIGRGTATFDGLSIAWSVAEHLARGGAGPKTLFATHYHELTDLAADLPGVGNLHVSAREWQDGVVFLRKIEEGGSDRSLGSRSRAWPASPRRSWSAPRRSSATWSARSSTARDGRGWLHSRPGSPRPAASSACSRPRTKASSTTSARSTPTT